jgi:hypothetical protein
VLIQSDGRLGEASDIKQDHGTVDPEKPRMFRSEASPSADTTARTRT